MSLRSPIGYIIPDETVRVAQACFPNGCLVMQVADELGLIYTNAQFASLYPNNGQPALDPARLALILVLQFLEDLSDEQTAEAVRDRIAWKYALALELTDQGFDPSVLCEFRKRLITGQAEALLLDTLLSHLQERGLLKARGRQRTDSSHGLASIRTLNRLSCIVETMRFALNTLASLHADWLRPHIDPDWFERYAARSQETRLPHEQTKRQAFATTVGADGFRLLALLDQQDTPATIRDLPAVLVLRQVWWQQFYAPSLPGDVRWRESDDSPPSSSLIHSPYDAEARYGTKRELHWVGYKVHLSESCDDDSPRIITHVLTTPATTTDDSVTEAIHDALAAKGLTPSEHLVDAGYTEANVLVSSRNEHQIDLVGPMADDTSWQARANQGYDLSSFTIDWQAQVVSCPQGKQSCYWREQQSKSGGEEIQVRFAAADCAGCAVREKCTKAKNGRPRLLTLRAQEPFEAMQQARQRQKTDEFKQRYAMRAGCESTVSQGMRAFGLRRSRYRGLAKTHLQHILTAVAMTLVRVIAWLNSPEPTPKRQGAFAGLAPV